MEVGDIILHEGSQGHIITTDGALSGLSNQDNIEHAIYTFTKRSEYKTYRRTSAILMMVST